MVIFRDDNDIPRAHFFSVHTAVPYTTIPHPVAWNLAVHGPNDMARNGRLLTALTDTESTRYPFFPVISTGAIN